MSNAQERCREIALAGVEVLQASTLRAYLFPNAEHKVRQGVVIVCIDPSKDLELVVEIGVVGVEQTLVDCRESEQEMGEFLPERLLDCHVRTQSKVPVERCEPSRARVRAARNPHPWIC